MTDAKTTSNGSNSGNGNGSVPTVKVPLPEWAEGLIDLALERHLNACPLRPRVEKLEIRLSSLIAFMVGSGLLGGSVGAFIAKVLL